MFRITLGLACLVAFGTCAVSAQAHKPIFSDGSEQDPESAIRIDDVAVSYVVYHEATTEAPLLWLSFDATAGQEIFAQLGVPVIDRLRDLRPSLALLGPGLPEVELPFSMPNGLGGLVLSSDEVTDPELFYEPITRTESWILGDLETSALQSGRHYLVAWVPSGQTGKLWVAPGREEQFGLEDIVSLPATIKQVRAFHEVAAARCACCLPALGAGAFLFGGMWLAKARRASRKTP